MNTIAIRKKWYRVKARNRDVHFQSTFLVDNPKTKYSTFGDGVAINKLIGDLASGSEYNIINCYNQP